MKRFEIGWKSGEVELIDGDVIQPAGGAVAVLRASAAVTAQGQASLELIKLINFDSVHYIEKVEVLN